MKVIARLLILAWIAEDMRKKKKKKRLKKKKAMLAKKERQKRKHAKAMTKAPALKLALSEKNKKAIKKSLPYILASLICLLIFVDSHRRKASAAMLKSMMSH